ncbi:MAG: adenylyl-sulfate kinase [Ruminococcaceae bacterium]|nr:adenylyl-sulfate kinase [Oscillospiraceae bacterium]
MRVIDLENINHAMQNETHFVLRCEEVFHDKISSAAASILTERRKKPIVALTGPSGSGKTTTAMRLQEYLENLGVKVCLLSMDNFFLPQDQRPPEATDWESPYCVNIDLLIDTIHQLNEGKEVQVPWYDFLTGNTGGYRTMQGDRDAIIIAEGIHMLNPLIFDRLRNEATGIYVAPRTRIITNDDKIVRPDQLRVARRLIRDYNNRGHSLRQTVERARSVNRGEVNYIAPFKGNADIHIDTFHDYEPCILAKYLNEIPQFREELTDDFLAEHDLTDLMKVVHGVPSLQTTYVPKNSLIREFVGGSSYSY